MTTTLDTLIAALRGQRCWGVVAGAGTGSMMTLDFGKRIPLNPPLRNKRLSSELQNFRGEYSIFVEGCAWRMEEGKKIVCGWRDAETFIGEQIERSVVGRKLIKATIVRPAFDLDLLFTGDHRLRLFCDQTAGENALDNYSVRSPSGWITVGPSSQVCVDSSLR